MKRPNDFVYENAVKASLAAIVCSNEKGLITLWNPAATSIFGYSEEEALGQPLTILMSKEDKNKKGLQRLITTGKSKLAGKGIEVSALNKKGESVLLELSLAAYKSKERWEFIAVFRDITECKETEKQLRKRERQLTTLAEASRSINESLHEKEIKIKLVEYACELVACESGAIGIFNDKEMVFTEYLKDNKYIPVDLKFPPGYGVPGHIINTRKYYISDNAKLDEHVIPEIRQQLGFRKLIDTPILDREGELLGCFEMHDRHDGLGFDNQDIQMLESLSCIVSGALVNARLLKSLANTLKEKIEAEANIRMLSSSVEQASDAILITDLKGDMIYVNSAFTELTGYSEKEIIGKNPRVLNSGTQSKLFYKNMWKEINQSKSWHGRIIDRKKDGSFYPAILTISPIKDDSGEVTNYLGIQQDLTAYENLEGQFHQAQKMEALGTLVGGIAHDFNNMLAGITGNTYLLKRKVKKGNLIEAIDRISAIEVLGQRAAGMVSQLLTFARKGIVRMGELSMNSFMKESIKLAQVTIPENIHVLHDITSEDMLIKGDITQLQQVLLNLLNNARDAVEGVAEPRIELRLKHYIADDDFISRHPEAGKFAHLSVSDNGCGIAKELLDQVFDPFFTTKAVGKGTGLGLSMVYGAIQGHEGVIEVDSKQGRGTTFHIYLPLIEQAGETVMDAVTVETLEAQGEVILLADDDVHVRETTSEVLESMGYKVLQAKDGLEAVELLKVHCGEVALAILDVVMPHLGGTALAKRLREINSDVPLIFVTGYDKDHVLGGNEDMLDSEILIKPVNFDTLSHSIRKFLD